MRVFGLVTLISLISSTLLSSAAALPANALAARQSVSSVANDIPTPGSLNAPGGLPDKRQLGESKLIKCSVRYGDLSIFMATQNWTRRCP